MNAPLIELRGVRKRYVNGEMAVEVLRGITLDIQAGEFVAIMGASGSGKSTLMHILGCLDRPSDGEYRFNGRDVAELDEESLAWLRREAFGFVFQGYHLLASGSATENVEVPAVYAGLARGERRERARELLTRLGLGERLDHRPNQLSGGQQQRVSIARALMNGGHVILADEPTGALDSRSGAEVMALLGELAREGHTVILITHDREVAAHADRVIEIADGEVVSDDGAQGCEAAAVEPPSLENAYCSRRKAVPLAEAFEACRMALKALHANLFRTLLTLLGVVIGVGSVVAMLAIGEGARAQVMERISAMGTNLLVVRPGYEGFGWRGPEGNPTTLVPQDAVAVAALPNVLAAVPENASSATARAAGRDTTTQVTATTADYPLLRNWHPQRGVFLSDEDQRRYAAVAVIGQTVARTLFGQADPLGEFLLLDNVPFQVIGVMGEQGATAWGDDADDVVFVPLSTGSLRLSGQRHLRSVTVAVEDMARMDETEAAVAALLRERHGVEDFRIRNTAALVETATATQNTLTLLLGSIAAISLLVGGIGVMNIMLVSVTERTREIGIRMATGARTRNILQQFLVEAVVVSAMGGVVGVLAGIGAGLLIGALAMPVQFSIPIMALAFACAAGTGLIFGFAPALKAARLDPVAALNAE
ncbi:MacB family efflux pump subunit [Billgrantia endophytica]|uniref:Macrolide ABC transporter permease/ATP-binding protein MacB n=1 Tax=Billgrantia endophytica TaxID=2033802 RepID=A0A2N7U207_9GAMM|nr:MacB family efflux pump subunit [Halomonas endophytica]PMR74468.1 macrolide ABC transporter permease/ATP-binding protein MacB [Halomonas endophytica]